MQQYYVTSPVIAYIHLYQEMYLPLASGNLEVHSMVMKLLRELAVFQYLTCVQDRLFVLWRDLCA